MVSLNTSHSPVCAPRRIGDCRRRATSAIIAPQRIARAGPSNVAMNSDAPASGRRISWPRKRSISRFANASSRSRCADRRRRSPLNWVTGSRRRTTPSPARDRDRRRALEAGQKPLDLVEHRVLIADERQVIVARQLDEPRVRNALGHIAALFDAQAAIAGAVEDQRRHADRRQHVRTSISAFMRVSASAAPGLAPMRR